MLVAKTKHMPQFVTEDADLVETRGEIAGIDQRGAAGTSGTADLAAAAPADPGIPPPLTLEEFDDLQETLRQEQRGDSTLSEQGLLGGRTTWLADHRMDGYIHWILKFHPQSARELSRD